MPQIDPITGRVIVQRRSVVRRDVQRQLAQRERSSSDGDSYAIGLDLAQVRDYSAFAIVERVERSEGPEYHVRNLARFDIGTPYPEIVSRMGRLLEHPEMSDRARLVLDRTGVGAPVADMFLHAGYDPFPIVFTGGQRETSRGRTLYVPRSYFVSTLQILLQEERLKIANSLSTAAILERELLNFSLRRNVDEDLADSWRENDHDDLVFAAAMACYYFERRNRQQPIAVRARVLAI